METKSVILANKNFVIRLHDVIRDVERKKKRKEERKKDT